MRTACRTIAGKLMTPDSAFGAKGTAAASRDRSLLVTTIARPYGLTRQIAEAGTGQELPHFRHDVKRTVSSACALAAPQGRCEMGRAESEG